MNENVDELLENCAMCEKKKSLKTLQYMLRILLHMLVKSNFSFRTKANNTKSYNDTSLFGWDVSLEVIY